ncbi:tyrosine-type recombinase/integrase [uncultured Ruegeria sp.]|uniref:tyrosine-type recombinase/integrase n=1 Tax=uncultured Ruegeria sp. TaxID=259304 RepID=UPI0026288DBA|nr:tyrosine-type recombinase/integrase [uncultured Ruegeria sp.]
MYAVEALTPFWGNLKVSDVRGEVCRRYAKWRKKVVKRDPKTKEPIEFEPISQGTARKELGTLRAAINYCHGEGYLTNAPAVTMPDKTEPKERWLTRQEAARLLNAARTGDKTRHLAQFIIIALYTGTRKDAILRMGFERNTLGGRFDLENGLMYRKGDSERSTKKARKPAKIPRQLAVHLKIWRANGQRWAVEYEGARVGSLKRSFNNAVRRAGLKDVTPHTLKHTAITWALQNGASTWDAAGFFSTSVETIEKIYGHHSPEHQATALRAVERR